MKTQFKTIIAVIAILVLHGSNANAQSTRTPGIRYSVGADFGLPVASLSNLYKWSLGGSLQADIPVLGDNLYLTVNAGYTNIFTERSIATKVNDIHLIPVKAGLKYFPISNFYVQGEAGASFLINNDAPGTKNAAFVYAPQIGYLIPLGANSAIDAGFRFEGNSKFSDHGSSSNFLGLRLAYAFPIGK